MRGPDLTLSAYASATGAHVVRRPNDRRFDAFLEQFDETAERRRLTASGIHYVGRSETRFPALLRAIHDPPPGLYMRGDGAVELLARPCVAIVGARACSGYGRAVGRTLAQELAAAGVVVVSGLARGIDGEAHRGALAAGGPTIAVLGCGIDRDYPAVHAELARRITAVGAVVSEYGPGVEPAPWRFPARNRIIAGLSAATVVVEARERSGALITADFALEEGRDVFAVPGEITSALSAGTNALLRLGRAVQIDTRASRVLLERPRGRVELSKTVETIPVAGTRFAASSCATVCRIGSRNRRSSSAESAADLGRVSPGKDALHPGRMPAASARRSHALRVQRAGDLRHPAAGPM